MASIEATLKHIEMTMVGTIGAKPPPIPRDATSPRKATGQGQTTSRRASQRQSVCLKVDIFPLVDDSQDLWTSTLRRGLTVDLSEQGMLLSRGGYLPEGSVVRVFFRLPDHHARPVGCYARVVRSDLRNRPRYGLRFIGLSPTDAHRIGRFTATFSTTDSKASRSNALC